MNLIIDVPENIPPSLVFATVATGAFRGLVVDVLWMRADKLKEERQFYDARQLAEWITILQPRFASVWEFHAWNMAYNISVTVPLDPKTGSGYQERWHWVKNGYELLRDDAISKYKLKNIELYREIGRIFQHKIGGVSDDANKYYKLQLALAMEPLLGPADNQYYDALAESPKTWKEIAGDPNVNKLIKNLQSADEAFAGEKDFVSNYLVLRQDPNRYPSAGRILEDFAGTEELEKLDVFVNADQLRRVWKLDPNSMRELNKTYGPIDWNDPNIHLPLDWRHPDTHAIYWAVKGLQINAQDQSGEISIRETNTDRIVAHSLQNLFRYGRIFINDYVSVITPADPAQKPKIQKRQEIFLSPELRMFEPYNQSALAILEKHNTGDNKGVYESLQNGHRNMLVNAVFSFYQAGHERQAQKIYDELRKLYPRDDFKVPIEVFARKRLLEELESIGINDVREQIMAILSRSYYYYAIRDDDAAFNYENMAKNLYNYYQKGHDQEYRIDLPELNVLRYWALVYFRYNELYPEYIRQALVNRIRIERPALWEQLMAEENKIKKTEQPK
ncbi:MAG: hypothetical protein JW715_12990 [Sedimentisphaerales bacterium]|nr:hypothetical protein [Sedimentisphaerales bacterium]